MSGFLLTTAGEFDRRWADALSFKPQTAAAAIDWKDLRGVVTRVDRTERWAPAHDPVSGVSVALGGRLSLDPAQWREAEDLPYRGGSAARLVLRDWLANPGRIAATLNGPFCVLIFDPRRRELQLLTDRMGAYPVYAAEGGELRLASHPDVLADYLAAEGRAPELDHDTLAECLAMGTSVHPYTYYRTIRQLDPASHHVYSLSAPTGPARVSVYWRPRSPAPSELPGEEALAEDLAAALRTAGRRRTPAATRTGLLLSGGADSRALLFALADPAAIETLTFCDAPNAEVAIARRIAQAAGASHQVLVREPEFYGHGARETVRITGGMWSIKDAHYEGFAEVLAARGFDALMTGCYADYMLKGLGYNRRERRFAGRRLPFEALADYDPCFYQPCASIAPPWQRRVQARLERRFTAEARGRYANDPSAVEDLRIRPLSREADAMGRLYLWRTLPWDPVMTDNEIVEFYARMPPALKLNARVFRKAVLRLLPAAARRIPNNNDHAPMDASDFTRAIRYLAYNAGARLRRRLGGAGSPERLATATSWPNFAYYLAHSPVIAGLWNGPTRAQRELLGELTGGDPWAVPLAQWAARDDLLLRLLTLRLWLEQRGI